MPDLHHKRDYSITENMIQSLIQKQHDEYLAQTTSLNLPNSYDILQLKKLSLISRLEFHNIIETI